MEKEVGGGIGMGNICKPMAVSFQCMTKSTTNKKEKKRKSINVIHNIKKLKENKYTPILVNSEEASDKIQYTFIIQILNKLGKEGNFFNLKVYSPKSYS